MKKLKTQKLLASILSAALLCPYGFTPHQIILEKNNFSTLAPKTQTTQFNGAPETLDRQKALEELEYVLGEKGPAGNGDGNGNGALSLARIKKLFGTLFTSFNDKDKKEAPPAKSQVDRAALYFDGKLTTSPFTTDFRPSTRADVKLVTELPEADRNYFRTVALRSLIRGEGVFSVLTAGAGLRMNINDTPPEVKKIAEEMATEAQPELKSKAAVPIGRDRGGRPFSFLGACLTNMANLQSQISSLMGGKPVRNLVLIATSDEYRQELNSELAIHGNYGIPTEDVVINQETLGYQAYANAKDVRKVIGTEQEAAVAKLKEEMKIIGAVPTAEEMETARNEVADRFLPALEKAAKIETDLALGNKNAVIMKEEKTPLGHGEFLHQMIASGLLLHLYNRRVKWISVRNIDNTAAKFDEEWLITLGMFLARRLDMQPEVSKRKKGQKGGGLYVLPGGKQILNEDPAVEASLKKFRGDQTQRGFEELVAKDMDLQFLIEDGASVELELYSMNFNGRTVTKKELLDLQSKGELLVFKKSDRYYFYEMVTPNSSYWINDAVCLFNLHYAMSFYRKDGQTDEEFAEELRRASPQELLEIADRGRSKFPVLVDPKPAKSRGMVSAKMETNFWQGTSTVNGDVKIEAIGVNSVSDIEQDFDNPNAGKEYRIKLMRKLRMLATKRWTGPVESYEVNKKYIPLILEIITDLDLLGLGKKADDPLFLAELKKKITPYPHTILHRIGQTARIRKITRRVMEYLQDTIQAKLSITQSSPVSERGERAFATSL